MPVKDNDKVYFKIKSGAIKTGVYDAKTKMVLMSGGKKAKPPKRALHHTRKGAMDEPFVDVTNKDPILGAKPKAKKVKVDFEDLYGGPLQNYINDWADGSDEAKAQGFTFAKVKAAIKKMLKDYNQQENTSIEGAAKFIKNMTTKEQEKYMKKNEKEKPTPKKTAMDKKAQEGKLTQKAFLEDVESQDGYEKARDKHYEKLMDDVLYDMSNDTDTSELTEKQQNTFMGRAEKRAYREQQTFLKELFTKLIKGKKFKSFKEASKLFITNMK